MNNSSESSLPFHLKNVSVLVSDGYTHDFTDDCVRNTHLPTQSR